MSDHSNSFRRAFLKALIDLRELFGLGVGVTSTPADDDETWWASWNIQLGGRTYILNLVPLSMSERSFVKAPEDEPN